MSLPVSEEHFTFVIWSNEYLDWDNYRDAFEEDYSSLTDDEKYQLMCDLNNDYLDDERRNLDIQVGTPIIVIADVGRWDGRHTGYGRQDQWRHQRGGRRNLVCGRQGRSPPGRLSSRRTKLLISTVNTGKTSARRLSRTSKERSSTIR